MDLPPSGWYPDPYGVPGLLRWWDGSTWTQHTHPGAGTEGADGGAPAATVQQTTVQPVVQPTTVQPTAVQPTTVQPAVQQGGPQPGVQPTTVQPAVQPTRVQPPVQPTTVQPPVQPTRIQPPPQGADAQGTQVLFLGDDAWTAPGGPARGDLYGYQRAQQRRRRLWVASGLTGGILVALALVALLVQHLGRTPTTPLAATTPATHAPTTPPPSPTPSPTPSATSGSVINDGTSGLSYSLLSSWQPGCPSGMNNVFPWSTGESAIAGQINGGQTAWYGVACSGVLPQSYGYNGVADLDNTATNVANQFSNVYYSALQHTSQPELSQPLMVSGHAAWEVKFLQTYTNAQAQGASWPNELAAVVVVDLGTGIAPSVFYVSVPNDLNEGNVDSLVSSLKLTVPPQPGGGGGSPGDGSPGDGGSPAPGAGSPTAGP